MSRRTQNSSNKQTSFSLISHGGSSATPKFYSSSRRTSKPNSLRAERKTALANVEVVEVTEFTRRVQLLTSPGRSFEPRPPVRGGRIALVVLLLALIGLYYWLRPAPLTDRLSVPIDYPSPLDVGTLPETVARSRSKVVHSVRKNENLQRVFTKYGLDLSFVDGVDEKLREVDSSYGVRQALLPGSKLSIIFDRLGYVTELNLRFMKGEYLTLQPKKLGVVSRHLSKIRPKSGEELVSGVIRNSFAADATRVGVSYQVIDSLVDLFSDRIEFRKDFQDGDRFSILYGELTGENVNPETDQRPILGVLFELSGEKHAAIRYVGSDGKIRYFDEDGALIGNTFLRFPLRFSRISSTFSESRFHPVLKRSRPHNGVDFAAPVGTAVRSVASGKVVLAGYRGPSGNMVRIRHNDRYTTEYFHLSKVQPGVASGKSVSKGEIIGAVGCTGLCTGPHLHFGFFDRGRYADPLKTKLPMDDALGKGIAIDSKYLSQLLKKTRRVGRTREK